MYEKPLVFKNGLLDPTSLLEFMDDCHCDDLEVLQPPGSHKSEYHHLYFPKKQYKNNFTELPIRRLRNSKYNLIEMLSCQEDLYHQTVAGIVPKDQIDLEAADLYLEESQWLTNYAASSLAIAETHEDLAISSSFTRARVESLSARLAILSEMQLEEAEQVNSISVIEHSIVSGALIKYLRQKPEPGLQSLVNDRLATDTLVMPTKIYGTRGLRVNVEDRLQERVSAERWIVRRLFTTASEAA